MKLKDLLCNIFQCNERYIKSLGLDPEILEKEIVHDDWSDKPMSQIHEATMDYDRDVIILR